MKATLLLIFLLFGSTLFSQNTGLYGKRLSVEADFIGSFPLFFMLDNEYYHYKSSGSNVVEGNDMFDFGVRFSASYALLNNFGIGMEYGKDFLNIAGPVSLNKENLFFGDNDYIQLQHEMIKIETTTIMPRIEFTSHNGLLPVGLNHQIGFGFTSTKLIEDDYAYRMNDDYSGYIDLSDFEETFYNYDNDPIKGYALMYALNVRTPLNKSLMFSYGVRYTLNFTPYSKYESPGSSDNAYWLKQSAAFELVKSRKERSFIFLNLGLALAI